jgi:hypothetical protein
MGLRLTVGFSKNPRLRPLVEKAVKTAIWNLSTVILPNYSTDTHRCSSAHY